MKQNYLKSFCARFLTLLVLALLSTNLAWGAVEKVSASQLESGGKYVIVATYDNTEYLLKPATFSAKGSTAEKFSSTTITESSAWIFTKSGETWTIKLSTGEGLYFTNDNNGVACAEKKGASFTITATTNNATTSYLTASDGTNTRYLALYQGSNWRCYKNTSNGVPTIQLYKITDAPAAKLTSIAISGTPKTTYEAGEEFDITGLIVTGTYDTKDPEVITEGISWEITPSGALTAGTTSVSVTATVDGKSDSKDYAVTVTEHTVTPGTYEISLNNALYGISTGNNGTEQSVKSHDITIVSGCSSSASSKTYYDAGHIRYYADSYLKLSVPTGYEITSVVFAEPTSSKNWSGSITSTPETYNAGTKTWTGKSQNVDFAFGAQNRAASITVTFAEKKTISGITIKNAPTKTTYYVGDEFDPAGLVITASYASGDPEDIAYSDANKDAFSFSGFNSAAVATDQVITVTYAEKSATFTVNIEEARVLNSIEVASNPAKMVYEVGEALDLTGLVVNGIFSKGDPEPVEYTADPADGTTLNAVGTTTVTLTSVDNTELTTSFDVTVKAIDGDRLTPKAVGNKSSYAQWDNAYVGTYATYIGYAMGGDAKFQLKSNDNVAGIVSTVSDGNIAKVKVTWDNSTTSGRVLDVYGSNVAYTAASDLYNDSKKGTKIGSIKYGESTELNISEGKYAYVGIRSASGALYLTNVTFVWKDKETYTREVTPDKFGTICLPYGGVIKGADLYSVTGVDNADEPSVLYLEAVEGNTAEAGVPYIFKATSNKLSAVYEGTAANVAGVANGLVGSYTKETIAAGAKNYILNNNQWRYVPYGNTNYVGANKAYLDLSKLSASSKSEVDMLFDSEPTGIEAVSLKSAFLEGIEIYNLNGMRVNENYKGIVIVNGKKYINK